MTLKGVNLGSWLLMEGYILGGRNIAESVFKRNFKKYNGARALREFEARFRINFINEIDFLNISKMGANCVRLPFSCRLISENKDGISYLKNALYWAHKYNLGVILDLHAAPGAQNCDWHADSKEGKALFWEKRRYRDQAIGIWESIIAEFKDEPALIGFDIVNEPVLGSIPTAVLKDFYKNAIGRIKAIDKKHRIFLEGDIWAQRIDFLQDLLEENISISIHTYQPLSYTFNYVPYCKFPGEIDKEFWDTARLERYLQPYFEFSRKNKVDIFVGEFGINWRGGHWGELDYLSGILSIFEKFSFSYTYWTYKAISGYVFPDGIYQYIPDNAYVKREGPVCGWENYIEFWAKEKEKIADFWMTKNFTPNQALIDVLGRYFAKGGK
ncbi:MAG: cellulase family glycosylhydrolase [Candidatus Omnitrophota bacterium]|jgi:aryl-phospho-beta-D-glucosidase BglC (GH1 family)